MGEQVTKISKWAPNIVVGQCGTLALTQIILNTVKKCMEETGDHDFTVENIVDNCCQGYYAAREMYDDMPKEAIAKIVVAGKLQSGALGAVLVIASNDEVETEIYEAKDIPSTLILEPTDMSSELCNELFKRALLTTKKPEYGHADLLETVHRKAVRFVAQRSAFVGKDSDYIMIVK